jgi:hypothetical protein
VQGSGADIWGTADSFHFVHQTSSDVGAAQALVVDLQNTNTFAKAGVMVRSSLAPNAATAILDVRPNGALEFMVRPTDGAPMRFIATALAFQYVRLTWSNGTVLAWRAGPSGTFWDLIGTAALALPASTEAGLVVTSHDQSQLATAHFTNVSPVFQPPPVWNSIDVGSVGKPGGASEDNGVWTVSGAGDDIWGTADAFQFLYRSTTENMGFLRVRIDDMQNTHAFAKAGLMVRLGLDPDSPCVILDVTPGGNVEFMTRQTKGGEMVYVGGITVTFPVVLELGNAGGFGNAIHLVPAVVQPDGSRVPVFGPGRLLPSSSQFYAGAVVTSHDASQLNTAHMRGLSLFTGATFPLAVGDTGLIGNVAVDRTITVEGAGADIWGTADSFQFAAAQVGSQDLVFSQRILSLNAANPFAKGGVMYRESLDPGAPSVILDAKPDGGVEFMARLCGACETTYLGGATITFPAYLVLIRNGSSFTARVSQTDPRGDQEIGTVVVPMSNPYRGLAVTSHDLSRTAIAVFDDPFGTLAD